MATEEAYDIQNFKLEAEAGDKNYREKPFDEHTNMIMNPMRKAAHDTYSKFQSTSNKAQRRESVKKVIVFDDGSAIELVPAVTREVRDWETREKEFIRRESILLQNIQAVKEDNNFVLQQTHKHHTEKYMTAASKHKKVIGVSVFVIFALIIATIILAVNNGANIVQQIIGGASEKNGTVVIIDKTVKTYNIIANELKDALLQENVYNGKRLRRFRMLSHVIEELETSKPLLLQDKIVDSIYNSALQEMKTVNNENICDIVMAGISGSYNVLFEQIQNHDDKSKQLILARIATSFIYSTESRNTVKYTLDCTPAQYLKYANGVLTSKDNNIKSIIEILASIIGQQSVFKLFSNVDNRAGAIEYACESITGRLNDKSLVSSLAKGMFCQ
jgi:hypothetical protein